MSIILSILKRTFFFISILFFFILLLNQHTSQADAASSCKIHLAVPPRCFAFEVDSDPKAGKTKENYNDPILASFESKLRLKPGEGGCPDAGAGVRPSCGDPRYASYYRVTQCSPNGSWRGDPDRIKEATAYRVQQACNGILNAGNSPVLVNFRNRVNYMLGEFDTRYGSEARRANWNHIMTQVKTGNTTFAQMYSYEDDMNYLSQKIFGKTWKQVQQEENASSCSMNSWDSLCTDEGVGESGINYWPYCGGGSVCSSHKQERTESDPPTFVCSNYNPSSAKQDTRTTCNLDGVDPASYCKLKLAVPPRSFPVDIDQRRLAGKTKENYWKMWDINKEQYSTKDLERPVGKRRDDGGNVVVDPKYCYINNDQIDIDKAQCGKSWYYAWAQCSPGGSWRPVIPHGERGKAGNGHVTSACLGRIVVNVSPYLVNFRNRAIYANGFNFRTRFGRFQGRRVVWNYIMGEVRSGGTTFGQEYTYDEDMNFLSNLVFGKSWAKVQADEKRNSCAMDSWNKVCAYDYSPDDSNPTFCPGNGKCNNHEPPNLSQDNPPTMTCSS